MDRRSRARELTMQALYQLDVQGNDVYDSLSKFFMESEKDTYIGQLAWNWTKGTWDNIKECDELITTATIKWQFARLSPVDKSILRLSVYHLKFCNDIPPKVVINEAIELAKKFSTDKSPAFVNGVLDAILKKIGSA
ncbi:MAG: transcription antitermination factor NusB [Sedimentisphaerales bacterium]|nr:transcription antitermination factor NusB [Sedimentisphaerales bacterium]